MKNNLCFEVNIGEQNSSNPCTSILYFWNLYSDSGIYDLLASNYYLYPSADFNIYPCFLPDSDIAGSLIQPLNLPYSFPSNFCFNFYMNVVLPIPGLPTMLNLWLTLDIYISFNLKPKLNEY